MYANLHTATGRKLKKLLEIIADSVPFKPSMQKLAELIGVSRNQIADYLLYMERAGKKDSMITINFHLLTLNSQ